MTVHILPDVVAPKDVLFVAEGYQMDNEGYWIEIQRLRDEAGWYMHLSEKVSEDGRKPAVVLLAEGLARKFFEKGDPYRL